MIIKITPNIPLELSLSSSLVSALGILNKAVPLSSFLLRYTPGRDVYRYEFTTSDGRVWKQELRLVGSEYSMTFDIDDEFKLSEFSAHRDLRDLCLRLVKENSVTEIDVKF